MEFFNIGEQAIDGLRSQPVERFPRCGQAILVHLLAVVIIDVAVETPDEMILVDQLIQRGLRLTWFIKFLGVGEIYRIPPLDNGRMRCLPTYFPVWTGSNMLFVNKLKYILMNFIC